jgi:hypothetical protein
MRRNNEFGEIRFWVFKFPTILIINPLAEIQEILSFAQINPKEAKDSDPMKSAQRKTKSAAQ